MKQSKQIIIGLTCVIFVFVVIPIIGAVMYTNLPQKVTDVEEVKYLMPIFEDVPIVSADCEWCVEAGTIGAVLESSMSGKLVVTQEYCDYLLKNFQWRESKGSRYHYDIKVSDTMAYYLENNTHYVSDDYYMAMKMSDEVLDLYFSPEENAIYFYHYNL